MKEDMLEQIMKPKLLLGLVLVLSGGWFGCGTARADVGTYDSVEWLTAMADQIGVYHAGQIYGPHAEDVIKHPNLER